MNEHDHVDSYDSKHGRGDQSHTYKGHPKHAAFAVLAG